MHISGLSKTHQNEKDGGNIAGAYVCCMRKEFNSHQRNSIVFERFSVQRTVVNALRR